MIRRDSSWKPAADWGRFHQATRWMWRHVIAQFFENVHHISQIRGCRWTAHTSPDAWEMAINQEGLCEFHKQSVSPTIKYYVCIKAWCIFFLCAMELHLCSKTIKTDSWTSLLHRLTCLLPLAWTYTLSSILHTRSCCWKHSKEHQMCVNPQLKIVPNKCTFSSCLSNVW